MPKLRDYYGFSHSEARAVRDSKDPAEVVATRHNISVEQVRIARREPEPKPAKERVRMTDEEAMAIRQMDMDPDEIAEATGRSLQVIHNVLARRSFRHVPAKPNDYLHVPGRRRGRPRKLTEEKVRKIFHDHRRCDIVAEENGVTMDTVYKIWRRKVWKHITSPLPRNEPDMLVGANLNVDECARCLYEEDDLDMFGVYVRCLTALHMNGQLSDKEYARKLTKAEAKRDELISSRNTDVSPAKKGKGWLRK